MLAIGRPDMAALRNLDGPNRGRRKKEKTCVETSIACFMFQVGGESQVTGELKPGLKKCDCEMRSAAGGLQ